MNAYPLNRRLALYSKSSVDFGFAVQGQGSELEGSVRHSQAAACWTLVAHGWSKTTRGPLTVVCARHNELAQGQALDRRQRDCAAMSLCCFTLERMGRVCTEAATVVSETACTQHNHLRCVDREYVGTLVIIGES